MTRKHRPLHDHRRRRHPMNTAQTPTPREAADNTLTPGDRRANAASTARDAGPDSEVQPATLSAARRLASAAPAPAVTADVAESPEGAAEPDRPAAQQAAPSHPPGNRRANAASTAQVDAMPRWLRRQIGQDLPRIAEAYVPLPNAHFVPSILRRPGMVVTPPVTRASGAHLEPVGQHELDDDAKIPEFLRRQGVKPSDFVPRELRGAKAVTPPITHAPPGFVPSILRGGAVTPPITPSQAPPASVTPAVSVAPGSICPTCHCRVPARLSDAARQRAYRKRQREQRQGLAGD
jgi:hypothetical protein